MEITWLGHSCFRMRGREGVVVTDPFSKDAGYDWSRPRADIVTISHPHDNHNQLQRVAGDPKVISGPGEYEISNIFVTGIMTVAPATTAWEASRTYPPICPVSNCAWRAAGIARKSKQKKSRSETRRGIFTPPNDGRDSNK